jgi:hypothetical protein
VRRLDWQLIRPTQAGELGDGFEHVLYVRRLVQKLRDGRLPPPELQVLAEAEAGYLENTISCCDAVEAPRVSETLDWESRLVDEFATQETDADLETYIEARRDEPDCALCPAASRYSVFPIAPCEFSVGELEHIITDDEIKAQLAMRMRPPEMKRLAANLEDVLSKGAYVESRRVQSEDYLREAVRFLQSWATRGFGVLPLETDEFTDFEPHDEPTQVGPHDDPLTFH